MNILGLSFGYHNAAAALVRDGEPLYACEEERFSRRKFDPAYPRQAIEACLHTAGMTPNALDAVVFHEDTLLKLNRILETVGRKQPPPARLKDVLANWVRQNKFLPFESISRHLGIPFDKIHFCQHHLAHSAVGFYCSPFQESAVLSLDGVGEYETMRVSLGRGTDIEQVFSQSLPHSLGLFYSAFTAFLGFEINEGEYKVMGMAGYGRPARLSEVAGLIRLEPDGGFRLDERYFDFSGWNELPYTSAFLDLFGEPRRPEEPFDPSDTACDAVRERSRAYADLAASVQRVVEDVILHAARGALRRTGQRNLCLCGGVALNSAANNKLQRLLDGRLSIHPAAGDAGAALGAALAHTHQRLGLPRRKPLVSPYLGTEFTDEDVLRDLRRAGIPPGQRFEHARELVEEAARRLARGQVIGWVQGRFEWGPRSLGARSILADPTRPDMQARVNSKIKYREVFRPFAPVCAVEDAARFFELPPRMGEIPPQCFMLAVAPVRPEARPLLPAVTHCDGTARVQLVSREVNPVLHDLLKAFEKLSGVPVLLNTSFNLRGEPIVNTPYDAMRTFSWSHLDALAVGLHLIPRESLACAS